MPLLELRKPKLVSWLTPLIELVAVCMGILVNGRSMIAADKRERSKLCLRHP